LTIISLPAEEDALTKLVAELSGQLNNVKSVEHVAAAKQFNHVFRSYANYYNQARTHLSLNKDAPASRAVERAGHILCRPILGRLHHHYVRI